MMRVTASYEYDGQIDFWSGNGRRWDEDAACVFASFGPETTWAELLSELATDETDMDGKPLFERVEQQQLLAAIRQAVTPRGASFTYLARHADEPCLFALNYGADTKHQYGVEKCSCDACTADESPTVVLLLVIEDDGDETPDFTDY